MKKAILLLIILLSGTFITIKLLSLGSEDSTFNQTTRLKLGKSALWRSVFGLHNDGDARASYLKGTGPIVIEIVQWPGGDLNQEGLGDFVQKAKTYTGREIQVVNIDHIKAGKLSAKDLKDIAENVRSHAGAGHDNFFVVYAEDFDREGTEIAKTYQEFGMVMSDARLKEVVGNNGPTIQAQYVESTLLHEFGHLLGLPHNDDKDCIMNAQAEKPNETAGDFTGRYMPTDFCESELHQLDEIKNNFN